MCLSPCVITPRGFTSLQKKEAEYSFSGFITTNKQTNKQVEASQTNEQASQGFYCSGFIQPNKQTWQTKNRIGSLRAFSKKIRA